MTCRNLESNEEVKERENWMPYTQILEPKFVPHNQTVEHCSRVHNPSFMMGSSAAGDVKDMRQQSQGRSDSISSERPVERSPIRYQNTLHWNDLDNSMMERLPVTPTIAIGGATAPALIGPLSKQLQFKSHDHTFGRSNRIRCILFFDNCRVNLIHSIDTACSPNSSNL